MKTALFCLSLAALLAGCNPLPEGRELPNQEPAIQFLLAQVGAGSAHPPVRWVEPDCTTGAGQRGFEDAGACKVGTTIPGAGIFVVLDDPHTQDGKPRYSNTSLAHELLHGLGHDHPGAADWDISLAGVPREMHLARGKLGARSDIDLIVR